MNPQTVIEINNISKNYELGDFTGSTFLKDVKNYFLHRDNINSVQNDFYALKNISFNIEQGEIVSLIGANGAGKSTLLKILSRVTAPTQGVAKVKGRVGSLLEVGTGFHPLLTGRENIYLSGAILGMKPKEIKAKEDQIIDFAEIAQHIDTPIKRYSSGMLVRLGFSVAVHLNVDILLVDEVLAVADASFREKATERIKSLVDEEGKTTVFVSHNRTLVRTLCERGIVLNKGAVEYDGNIHSSLKFYEEQSYGDAVHSVTDTEHGLPDTEYVQLKSVAVEQKTNDAGLIIIDQDTDIVIKLKLKKPINNLSVMIQVVDGEGNFLIHSASSLEKNNMVGIGEYEIHATVPKNTMNAKQYYLNLICQSTGLYIQFKMDHVLNWHVKNHTNDLCERPVDSWLGLTSPTVVNWHYEKI